MPREDIRAILERYDSTDQPFSESEVADALRHAVQVSPPSTDDERVAILAEEFAFNVTPDYDHKGTSWDLYYGPMMTFKTDDDRVIEWPDMRTLDESTITYWKQRVHESRHPLLKARYADIVWEFSLKVTGQRADIKFAWQVIDSTLEAVTKGAYKRATEAVERLKRALSLALSVNDTERVKLVRDAIIELEDRIGDDTRRGLWGFCFDCLFENKKVPLEEQHRQKIIRDLEARLKRVSDPGSDRLDPFAAESAALRLAQYYRRVGDTDSVRRVLCQYRDAYLAAARRAEALVAQTWLKRVHQVLFEHGFAEEAARLEPLMRKYGRQSVNEMGTVSSEVRIPREEIERYVQSMVEGSFREVFQRIALHFLPDPERTRQQVLELARMAPLQAMVPQVVLDADGRPIATIGPVKSDLEGRVVQQISQDMHLTAPFLRMVLEALQERGDLAVDTVIDVLRECPLFQEERMGLIRRGLEGYFTADHMTAIHLLIPQIEAAIRHLLVLSGGQTFRPGRLGELRLKPLDAMLREPGIEQTLTNRGCTYLRVVLTDPRGWNLRNSVMHGLLATDQFVLKMSDRLLHVLAFLSMVRQQTED